MKAVQIEQYGGPEVIKVNDVEEPKPQKGQLLVEVYAGAVNPFDKTLITGTLKDKIPLTLPVTVGADFAGVVKGAGEETGEFEVGDQVFGSATVLGAGTGAFAQMLCVNIDKVAKKPDNISYEEAAGAVLVGVSALQALTENLSNIKNGKILIQGGAGGIGHVAVQMAKALGAHVSTVVGTDDIDFVKSLGATGVVDYKNQDFESVLTQYDAVFDTVGGNVTDRSMNVLRKGGTLVTMIGSPDEQLAMQKEVTAIRQNTKVNSERLTKLAEFLKSGQVKVTIGREFPYFEAQKAIEFLSDPARRGKAVLKFKN